MLKEFKEFIARGNVMDLAVGVIVGSAFTAIVKSLVSNIINPLIGIFAGKIDFSSIIFTVVRVGTFLNSVINFLIISFVIFVMVKFVNKFTKSKEDERKKEEKELSEEAEYLKEIVELLKEEKGIQPQPASVSNDDEKIRLNQNK